MRQKERDIKRKRDTERGIQIERLRQNPAASSNSLPVLPLPVSRVIFTGNEEKER